MSDALPSLSEIVERALASHANDVHVSMPGIVVSYDAATQTATVQPALRRVLQTEDGDQVAEEIPPIPNVPVSWPGGSGLTMHGTLEEGDTGDLLFSTWSHNEWQATGRVSTPGDLKPHNLGSAKFYPGLRSRKNAAPDTDNSFGIPGGLRVHFEETAVKVGTGAEFVALASLVLSELNALKGFIASAAGTEAAGGGLGGMTALNTAITSAWPSPSGVAASNLKADP